MRRLPLGVAFLVAGVLCVAALGCARSPAPSPQPVAVPASPPVAQSAPPSSAPPNAVPPAGPSSPLQAQIDRGTQIFQQTCARCHGAAGQGGPEAPMLVGRGALPLHAPAPRRIRRVPVAFRTAHDVGIFIKDNMPPDGPRLSMPDTASVLAFALNANGIRLTQPITPEYASTVVLH